MDRSRGLDGVLGSGIDWGWVRGIDLGRGIDWGWGQGIDWDSGGR